LPYRQARENVIDEMRGGFDHAPDGTGGTDAVTFTGVSDDEVVTTVGAAGARKSNGLHPFLLLLQTLDRHRHQHRRFQLDPRCRGQQTYQCVRSILKLATSPPT